MQNIQNIIFDLGGVFIGIDYYKTEKAFVDLGIKNFRDFYNQHHASDLFEKLETGELSETEFYDSFRQQTKSSITNKEIEEAWNAMLGRFYTENLTWLQDIKNRFKIYLFSNTNIIHYNAFQKIYKEQTGKESFDDYFITAYYSHDLGVRKPYPEAFEVILKKENLVPAETLFIDDTIKNIEGAKKVGMATIHLTSPEKLSEIDFGAI
jgi:putative hydrolase of the HAD superfamily